MTQKRNKEFLIISLIISLVLNLVLAYPYIFKSSLEEEEVVTELKEYNIEDCKNLAYEARQKRFNCQLEGLREFYGIDYESNTPSGGDCFFDMSTTYCISDSTAKIYLDEMGESCDKGFPKEEDVFALCLSDIEN